jgi:hypothetical protein
MLGRIHSVVLVEPDGIPGVPSPSSRGARGATRAKRLVVRLPLEVSNVFCCASTRCHSLGGSPLPGKIMNLSCSNYSGSRYRRREGKKRNSIKSSKLIGLLARLA